MNPADFGKGDLVRIGKGKVVWRIVGFGSFPGGTDYAALEAVEGYATRWAGLDELVRAS